MWRVTFPLTLRLPTQSSSSATDRLYDLFAVVVHVGSSPSHGHYLSLIRTRPGGKWLLFDDDHVQEVDAERLLAKCFGQGGLAIPTELQHANSTATTAKESGEGGAGYGSLDLPGDLLYKGLNGNETDRGKQSGGNGSTSAGYQLTNATGYILFYEAVEQRQF